MICSRCVLLSCSLLSLVTYIVGAEMTFKMFSFYGHNEKARFNVMKFSSPKFCFTATCRVNTGTIGFFCSRFKQFQCVFLKFCHIDESQAQGYSDRFDAFLKRTGLFGNQVGRVFSCRL